MFALVTPFDAFLPGWWLTAYFAAVLSLPALLILGLGIKLSRQRRRAPVHTIIPPAEIPTAFARQAQPWIGRIGFLGFPLLGCARTQDDSNGETYTWRLASTADKTLAVLTGTRPQDGGGTPRFTLTLVSFLSDGRVVVTADREITHRPPAHWLLSRQRFGKIEEQIAHHRSVTAGAPCFLPSPQELPARLAAEDQAVLEALVSSGDHRALNGTDASEGTRPALARIPQLALRSFAACFTGSAYPSPRRSDISRAPNATSAEDDEFRSAGGPAIAITPEQAVEEDLRRYRQLTKQKTGRQHFFQRSGILIATLIFFVAFFGLKSPLPTIGMLLGLIAVHEFGHWLAMKCFGYQGMGRFFVPWVGSVDRGRKLHAPAWQQYVTILAGPLPGLLAGLTILIGGFFVPTLPLWLLDLGGLALVYNGFQLLPFLPLDGGKIVDLLVFRDIPFLRPLFTAASALLTLAASFLLKSRVIRYLAIGMFAGLAWDVRMIKVVRGGRRLGWAGGVDEEDEALRRIFKGIREENNDGFFRSSDWHRQIEVLVSEVLRKRPRIGTRLFGGAFYALACVLPMLLVIGLLSLGVLDNLGSLRRHAAHQIEFAAAVPATPYTLTVAQEEALQSAVELTGDAAGDESNTIPRPGSPERTAIARKAHLAAVPALDKLDWKQVAAALREDPAHYSAPLSIWLELLCGKLEEATRENRHGEAIRRAEILLHAVATLEPAPTLTARELFRDTELRTLAAIEKLAASGKLDPASLQRLEARINASNKAPLPEVENSLLVSGWAEARTLELLGWTGEGESSSAGPAKTDARFWRHAYPRLKRMVESRAWESTPATVALARHWKKSRRIGEIPETLEEEASAAPGEAEFIYKFCEDQRQITWRRLTTLSALRLEAYRQKTGKLPPVWKHAVPGGASLTLVWAGQPHLLLDDRREEIGKSPLPAWLGMSRAHALGLDYECPLSAN